MTRDTLFLIRAPFENSTLAQGATYFCFDCAAMEGALLANPQWLRSIDVRRLPYPRPRHELAALIGEDNQGMPVLVLGDAEKAPPTAPRFLRRAFLTDPREITRYLASTLGGAGPHP
jgi:Protein of unknown function (DUF3088)